MAEVIGIASGLAGLSTAAFQASKALYQTIKSYQSHQQSVLDLLEENRALSGVLASLGKTITLSSDLDLSDLEFPLERCGQACKEFTEEIEKIASLSKGDRASFRGWAKLRYMGEDIDGFRRLLAGYKTMINIAIANATLQRSTLTSEKIDGYTQLIERAAANFEDRLGRIDGRLETLVERTAAGSESEEAAKAAAEAQQIQEERSTTEKYLQTCAHLLKQINGLRAKPQGPDSSAGSETGSVPEKIASEGLDECAESVSRMASRLASHERDLFDRLGEVLTRSGTSAADYEEIGKLRAEWQSTRAQMDILSKAEKKLGETTSVIENHATGNAIQVMVTVDGRPLHGKNEGTGPWTRQVGGRMSNESLQQVLQSMVSMSLAAYEDTKASRRKERVQEQPGAQAVDDSESSASSKFEDLYGEGFTLECESPTAATTERKIAQ